MLESNFSISYSANDIPALQQRTSEWAKNLSEIGVLTDNEIRTELGYDSLSGGDVIYKPTSMAPVDAAEYDTETTKRNNFVLRMKKLGCTDNEANELWTKTKQDS